MHGVNVHQVDEMADAALWIRLQPLCMHINGMSLPTMHIQRHYTLQ